MKIDKNVFYLGWVSFFTDMASAMVTTLLPVYVVFVLNEGVDKLGIIIAAATFVSYILRLVFGYLSDRYGIVKPFMVAGYALSALTKPLLAFTHSYESVAMLRALERVGKSVRSAPKDALISFYAKENASGRTFGFHKMLDVSGELLGALLIVAVFYFVAQSEALIRSIFLATLLPGLMGVGIVLFFVHDVPKSPKKSHKEVIDRDDLGLFWVIGSYFVFLLFFMGDQYFLVQAKHSGTSLVGIPLLVIASTLTQALISYSSGVLIDKVGHRLMLFFSFFAGILSTLLVYMEIFGGAFIALGIFTVISLNALRSYISAFARSKGFVYGVFYAGVALFGSAGALLIGKIWQSYGFETVFYISLAGMGFAFAVLLVNIIYHSLSASYQNDK